MRKEIKLIVVLILLLSTTNSKAQSSATAVVTVTIVEPVTLSSDRSQVFETLRSPSVFDVLFGNGKIYLPRDLGKIIAYNSTITAADFVINANDVYAVTIPQKIFVTNALGTGVMTADLLPTNASQDETVQNGKKHVVINADLQIKNGQTPGRYASQAFDVTVNFN